MTYNFDVHEKCLRELEKASSKNPVLAEAARKKMKEILEKPHHYKPLLHELAGEYRVHIMNCFVLKFMVDEAAQTVHFTFFGHHDQAYKR